jgi:16S rRNA (adenine1518-N6/adenine1519-N6)-dimethyltransferase
MERLTATAFGQRRKMLRSALKSIGGSALLERAAISPGRRAETLCIAEFDRLARLLCANERLDEGSQSGPARSRETRGMKD